MAKMQASFPQFLAFFPQFPVISADAVAAAQRRNLKALTEASQIVADGAKALAARQAEMLRRAYDLVGAQGAMKGDLYIGMPADGVAKAKAAYVKALANARELTDIAVKTQGQAWDVLTDCALANLDDLKRLSAQ